MLIRISTAAKILGVSKPTILRWFPDTVLQKVKGYSVALIDEDVIKTKKIELVNMDKSTCFRHRRKKPPLVEKEINEETYELKPVVLKYGNRICSHCHKKIPVGRICSCQQQEYRRKKETLCGLEEEYLVLL